ncbi:MAG: exodeoxyribonuclease V subunit gamma [Parachlamydiaceae bacterium]
MTDDVPFFFSNRLDILYEQLKRGLFNPDDPPFIRRFVVTYGPAMKTWLMLKMAQDPHLHISTGIEFLYLNQAFDQLLKMTTHAASLHLPSPLELSLAIENECMKIIHHFRYLSSEEQEDWSHLTHYLKLTPDDLNSSATLSLKMEKRLISLSQHLAALFLKYGRFGSPMVAEWELPGCRGWQPRLWKKLFTEKIGWTYPGKALLHEIVPSSPFTVHFFSISFITPCEFSFLCRLSKQVSVHYYLLSPCGVFWSDIRSDRENAYLQNYWQKKGRPTSTQLMNLEEFLRDRNPLLANFGRIGRQMAYQIEESVATTYAHYVLPEHVKLLGEELFLNDDLYLTETKTPLSLLHAVQADLLVMRNPQSLPPVDLKHTSSIQLHAAPNKRREIAILYNNLLHLISQDSSLCPSDIIVMAPQINDYAPYIESLFGQEDSQLDFQILDLGMHTQSEIVQGFLQLIELGNSRWNAANLLQLFEHPSFQRRHQLTQGDYFTIQHWIEQTAIRWGDDWFHRNELLKRNHCENGMVEETPVGTWDYGISRLLFGLAIQEQKESASFSPSLPPSPMEFSHSELMGRWMQLLHSLRDDLSPLEDGTRMTIEDWVNFLTCLLDGYFQPNVNEAKSVEEYSQLNIQFDILRNASRFFKHALYPFTSIKTHLITLLERHEMTYREDHLESVRFCSLVPLRSIPAKVIALLGMQEGAFPRTEHYSSLNLMMGHHGVDFSPLASDYDRYLFLEALHSAQGTLLLSYQGYSEQDGKEIPPSLLIEELVSYLDQYYTLEGKKFSEVCLFKHPFDSFDERYFESNTRLCNWSIKDYDAATICRQNLKRAPHSFLDDFLRVDHPQTTILPSNTQIDIRRLCSAARNPIKFHLNQVLEIYIENQEDRRLKIDEELVISSLDRYEIKQHSLKAPIESLLKEAERQGKLPFGLFKEVAAKRIKEEVKELHECLKKHSTHPSHIFTIQFCRSCLTPTQREDGGWLFPPISLQYDDGYQLFITGKLPHATQKGLISLSKGTLADAWKMWPQFLLYCYAAKWAPEHFEPQLIFTQAGQPKKAFFDDPENHLKQFIHYYALCLNNFSPLLPDWIPLILDNDARGLEDKIRAVFSESFHNYQSHDLKWILNKERLPTPDSIIKDWKPQAEQLAGDLIHFWFDSKKRAT